MKSVEYMTLKTPEEIAEEWREKLGTSEVCLQNCHWESEKEKLIELLLQDRKEVVRQLREAVVTHTEKDYPPEIDGKKAAEAWNYGMQRISEWLDRKAQDLIGEDE